MDTCERPEHEHYIVIVTVGQRKSIEMLESQTITHTHTHIERIDCDAKDFCAI